MKFIRKNLNLDGQRWSGLSRFVEREREGEKHFMGCGANVSVLKRVN